MKRRRIAAAIAALLLMGEVGDPADRLPDPGQEARAGALFHEIRCLVCQGESIAESDAPLAADLRRVVRDQVRAGRSNGQIRAWLEARYGPFVLLRPPYSPTNAALWASPFVVALIGAALFLRRGRAGGEAAELSPQDEARLAEIRGSGND